MGGFNWRNIVTIEPVMFLQMAGDTLTYVIFQNLFIEKICRNDLKYNETTCINASNETITDPEFKEIKNEIQGLSSNFLMQNALIENSLPIFLVLFLGVWSDKNRRRKPPLFTALLGKLIRSLALVLNSYFIQWPSIVLLITAALPHSMGGNNAVFLMASFSYLADTSVPRNRTWRLGIAEGFWQLGGPVGLFLGAYLFEKGGYMYVFGMSTICYTIALIYTVFLLPEVPKPKPSHYAKQFKKYGAINNKRIRYYSENVKYVTDIYDKEVQVDEECDNNSTSVYEDQNQTLLPPTYIVGESNNNNNNDDEVIETEEYIDSKTTVWEFLIGSLKAVVKKRPNHTRKQLLSLGLIMLFFGIAYNGEVNMKYLYTRNKLNFQVNQFSLWIIFEFFMMITGLCIVMPLMSRILKFSDPLSGTIASLGRGISRFLIATSTSPKQLYYSSLFETLGVIGPLSARSLASKCVLSDERGKIFAFLGCIEALVPLIAVSLYSFIYSHTLTYLPSAIYYLSVTIYFSNFVIFGILYISYKLKLIVFSGNDLSSLTAKDSMIVPYYSRRISVQ